MLNLVDIFYISIKKNITYFNEEELGYSQSNILIYSYNIINHICNHFPTQLHFLFLYFFLIFIGKNLGIYIYVSRVSWT